jgi:oxaloacetate decarboxylase beta subunit
VATKLAPQLLAPLSVAAYSYMSLVPIIQPAVIRFLTTPAERRIHMTYEEGPPVSRTARILFPIIVTVVAGLIAPISVALIGLLMFGNLIRECGVLDRLSRTAQQELTNLVTLLLGITIGATMEASSFLRIDTLLVLAMGLVAFVFDTAGGVIFAKVLNLFLRRKVNPMIGAAGISAFPMSGRLVAKMALAEDPTNYLIMHSIGANVAGQIGSVIAGGLVLTLVAQGVIG